MNCWDYMKCGREEDGINSNNLGVCPAFPDHGRDCWRIAGTFCQGTIQGTEAQKRKSCLTCYWYVMVGSLKIAKQETLNE